MTNQENAKKRTNSGEYSHFWTELHVEKNKFEKHNLKFNNKLQNLNVKWKER